MNILLYVWQIFSETTFYFFIFFASKLFQRKVAYRFPELLLSYNLGHNILELYNVFSADPINHK